MDSEERKDALANLAASLGWRLLAHWMELALKDVRDELEQPELSAVRSEYLRGRVATLREIALLPGRLAGE